MSRNVEVFVKVKINLCIDEGVEVSEIVDNLDLAISDTTTQADVCDFEIINHEVTDSR
jgi:hypothetical protein